MTSSDMRCRFAWPRSIRPPHRCCQRRTQSASPRSVRGMQRSRRLSPTRFRSPSPTRVAGRSSLPLPRCPLREAWRDSDRSHALMIDSSRRTPRTATSPTRERETGLSLGQAALPSNLDGDLRTHRNSEQTPGVAVGGDHISPLPQAENEGLQGTGNFFGPLLGSHATARPPDRRAPPQRFACKNNSRNPLACDSLATSAGSSK